jgi:Bardet-Biedl syndrome 2 protein
LQASKVAIGKFDGANCSLVLATNAGKIMVLNPQDTSLAAPGSRQPQLNINRQITALATGCLIPKSMRDVLLIGTQNFLQCYDVDQNKDIFFKDVPEGISCMVVGSCGSHSQPLVLVGGNCSVQGYNSMGTEVMWTVTGKLCCLQSKPTPCYHQLLHAAPP